MTITRELDVTVSQEKQRNIKAVTDVLDIWADNFIKKIAELNNKKLIQ